MTKIDRSEDMETHGAIAAQAAEFLQRRRLSRWTIADQAELDAWMDAATAHRVAYLRLLAGETLLERVADHEPHAAAQRGMPRTRKVLFALAASSLLTTGFAATAWYLLMPPVDRTYATGVGGLAIIRFGDGTSFELNTNSSIRYRMTTAERTVWLDRGEAYFRVAHNEMHPFSVIVQGHRVTDLGTEFLVKSSEDGLDVLLVKGRAQLSSDAPSTPKMTLVPGDQAVAVHGTTTMTKKTSQALADALSWRNGMLVFRETPLRDAVKEFNRYNETKLVIADPSIASMKFSARLKTDDFNDFVQLAQTVLGLRSEVRNGNIYLFSGKHEQRRTSARH